MANQPKKVYLRNIPSVEEILQGVERREEKCPSLPRVFLVQIIREVLEGKRRSILQAEDPEQLQGIDLSEEGLLGEVSKEIARQGASSLRRVINATGVIIHTNLGRSLLAPTALENLGIVARSYSNLEYDLVAGERGSRHVHLEEVLRRLTGAEAVLVVNNNAAAVLLCLDALAQGREVVVSRGQLVEIGGSFRIPDIMKKSGARLVEVGTTNKTRLEDYREAIHSETALLLKVHTSNFRVVGFTAEVSREALVALGSQCGLPVVEDLGSGNLLDLTRYGLMEEPTVQEVLKAGVDVVTFSGDKLLGGPQAGIIAGKKELLARIKKNPLLRALRVDKLTLAALEVTLRLYIEEKAIQEVPTLKMLTMPLEVLTRRCRALLRRIRGLNLDEDLLEIHSLSDHSQAGGGSLPQEQLPTVILSLRSPFASAEALERLFRSNEPPILGRRHKDLFCLDLRTIQEGEEEREVVQAIGRVAEILRPKR